MFENMNTTYGGYFAMILIYLVVRVLVNKYLHKFAVKSTFSNNKIAIIKLELIKKNKISHDTFIFVFKLPSDNEILGVPIG